MYMAVYEVDKQQATQQSSHPTEVKWSLTPLNKVNGSGGMLHNSPLSYYLSMRRCPCIKQKKR